MTTNLSNIKRVSQAFMNVYLENIAENDIKVIIDTMHYGENIPIITFVIKSTPENICKAFMGMQSFTTLNHNRWDFKNGNYDKILTVDAYCYDYICETDGIIIEIMFDE